MENGGPVEDDLALLRTYYRLGVRYITLTHNDNNRICDSATDEPEWGGLSPFGIDVVSEMNRIGMIIDVSHVSDDAFFDVIERSKAPVIASHSGCRAICDVPRDLTDEMLAALAENGGVIQIVFYSGFISQRYAEEFEKNRRELEPKFKQIEKETGDDRAEYWRRARKLWYAAMPEAPEIDILIDHIDHAVEVAGIDHVGLGSDYDGAGNFPKGLEDATGYPLITYHLLKRGYREKEIKKILGENFLRVFEQVEERAGS
jgi:membrane dipeptidase